MDVLCEAYNPIKSFPILVPFFLEQRDITEHYLYSYTGTKFFRAFRPGGVKTVAARILGITRGSLRNKVRALGIEMHYVPSAGSDDAG